MRGIWNLAKSSTSSGTVRIRLAAALAACKWRSRAARRQQTRPQAQARPPAIPARRPAARGGSTSTSTVGTAASPQPPPVLLYVVRPASPFRSSPSHLHSRPPIDLRR